MVIKTVTHIFKFTKEVTVEKMMEIIKKIIIASWGNQKDISTYSDISDELKMASLTITYNNKLPLIDRYSMKEILGTDGKIALVTRKKYRRGFLELTNVKVNKKNAPRQETTEIAEN